MYLSLILWTVASGVRYAESFMVRSGRDLIMVWCVLWKLNSTLLNMCTIPVKIKTQLWFPTNQCFLLIPSTKSAAFGEEGITESNVNFHLLIVHVTNEKLLSVSLQNDSEVWQFLIAHLFQITMTWSFQYAGLITWTMLWADVVSFWEHSKTTLKNEVTY